MGIFDLWSIPGAICNIGGTFAEIVKKYMTIINLIKHRKYHKRKIQIIRPQVKLIKSRGYNQDFLYVI